MFAERTMETGASSGTSTLTLGTSVSAWKTWRSQFADTTVVFYFAEISDGSIWEAGYGTLTYGSPDTITGRTLLLSSTGSLVDFASATAYVMSVPNAVAMKHMLNPIAATRPAWLQAGGTWRDYTLGLGTTWVEKIATSAVAGGDVEMGRLEVAAGIYLASPRRYWVDNGAANLTMTVNHIGRVIKFDTTAAVRNYTLLAGATAGISHGFRVWVMPYGGNNSVGLVPNGSEAIDGGTAAATMYVPANRVTELRWDTISGQWRTDLTNSPVMLPNGRLTLESAVPVSSTDQTGKATIYYTPTGGTGQVPLRAGSGFAMFPFSQLSNDTTSAASGAGPAALGSYQVVDVYVWLNAGVPTLTRSPKWSVGGTAGVTATMTIATPCVVTETAHGLWDGATKRFTTTGALPTGLAINTDYFVTKIDANTYNLSTTLANQVAGTKIATSGAQSGVHTAFNYTSVRGTGTGSAELAVVNGIYVNAVAITNGPAIGQGTYLGTVYGNVSAQIDLKKGSSASGGGEAIIGLWNAYNRVSFAGAVGNTATWAYASATIRAAGLYSTNRVTAVSGNKEDSLDGDYGQACYNSGGAYNADCNVGFRSTTTQGFSVPVSSSVSIGFNAARGNNSDLFLGLAYLAPTEAATSSGWTNVYGASLNYRWRY